MVSSKDTKCYSLHILAIPVLQFQLYPYTKDESYRNSIYLDTICHYTNIPLYCQTKTSVIMNEENVKKESEIKFIHHLLSNIYYKRAFDEDFNRGIRVIDSNKKSQFIWDNGNEIVMAFHSLWLRIECIEPLSGLAIFLSTFKLSLLDDEMKEFNPFFSKSKAIEILKEGLFSVADKNGHFYKFDAE